MSLVRERVSFDMRDQMMVIAALSFLSQAAARVVSAGRLVVPLTMSADSPSALNMMRISSLNVCQLSSVSTLTVAVSERRVEFVNIKGKRSRSEMTWYFGGRCILVCRQMRRAHNLLRCVSYS